MTTQDEEVARLLDFNQSLDIHLLDSFVMIMASGSGHQQQRAHEVLNLLKEHPLAWTRVDTILELSSNPQTKFYALQILQDLIESRWKLLPREQCVRIRDYIVGLVKDTSSKDHLAQLEKVLLRKMNITLVLIVKQEWPKNWSTFISQIVGAREENEGLRQNNMAILKLLSEEVFDFSSGNMTQIKAKHLKDSMRSEFLIVFRLAQSVMDNPTSDALVRETLDTLLRFLNWVPVEYIFRTSLITTLISKYLHGSTFQDVAFKSLIQIAGDVSTGPQCDDAFVSLFSQMMLKLEQVLPHDLNFKKALEEANAEDRDVMEEFIRNLAMFLSTMLKQHGPLMERSHIQYFMTALDYLLRISELDEEENFKICLEYWNVLVVDLYARGAGSPSVQEYQSILSRLRYIIISRMAKPEEVIVIVNEDGNVIRELLKNTDAIDQYNNMRETLVYLTHLDYFDAERIMMEKLWNLVNGLEWSWKNLNTLCWAIGSISGAFHEEDEKRFLVTVIKELLGLCEQARGTNNKAVIASNVMYVVGQYPRFLRTHWRFLKTVVNKLFEFMHETHDGVQDMACDTLMKIAKKCSRHFVCVQEREESPFIDEILSTTSTIICDLLPQQKHAFYEAVGYLISAQSDQLVQKTLIDHYMLLPNQDWDHIMNQANQNVQALENLDTVRRLADILMTNVRACQALGHPYVFQLDKIYLNMLKVYKVMSDYISGAIALYGENVKHNQLFKSMRLVKKEALKLIKDWISRSNDNDMVVRCFLHPLLDTVLHDYQNCVPSAREPEVLLMLATILNKLKGRMTPYIHRIYDAIFQSTLEMITKNLEEFPEHRTYFYVMLQAANNHCFPAIASLPPNKFKVVLDSIIWAFKHKMRNVAEIGLETMYQLLLNVSQNEAYAQTFYQPFFMDILQHVFSVVTDSFHTAHLTMHATILAYMFTIVETGRVTGSLNPAAPVINPPEALAAANVWYVQSYVADLLHNAFQHLSRSQLKVMVEGLFDLDQDVKELRKHLRDFLVQIKEFNGEDESDLFLEEREMELRQAREQKRLIQMSVPGILNPHEIAEEMQ